ncbi:MAG TPA: 5-methyltetrahydropteroyltriglutamate--homocysteine S-methyltransferase [Actinopolymorphaceae bacterium]
MVQKTVLGYPRIGPRRELKRALEGYWAGRIPADQLHRIASELRADVWTTLRDAGLDLIPSNTFSLYDHVLDTAVLVGAVPPEYREIDDPLDRYFAMARGGNGLRALEMTKWFDTNYHYIVPEIGPDTRFELVSDKPVEEYREAARLGIETRPVILGPLTFLLLAKPDSTAPKDFHPLDRLASLLEIYIHLLDQLADEGVTWVQLDEPALAADRTPEELSALASAYDRLGRQASRPKLTVTCSYGSMGEAQRILASTPVEGIGLDLTAASDVDTIGLADKVVYAGLVDGRNIWRTDMNRALSTAASLLGSVGELVVSTSSSLIHVPLDVEAETALDPDLKSRLAFARQKVDEIVLLGRALTDGRDSVADRWSRPSSAVTTDHHVQARLVALANGKRNGNGRSEYAIRSKAQQGALPLLPTTTIGSFPQTRELRAARADLRAGRIDRAAYDAIMRAEIDRVIALQEEIGLDVLVHGEPERNDMVQYFAELLQGYAITEHGWVQSYGSRCVRPPILHGDVSRPAPMTVGWTTYAQSRTDKPVKGIMTGPITMLAWSFVRDDQPFAETARQVALALRDEIRDLEAAGIRYIQVDEPALREKLPLRKAEQAAYLQWATEAFRLATSGVADTTQIHTHMCYSEFGEIVDAIDGLDADVTSVEAARSRMELVEDLHRVGYERGIGPGVYDIHSPRVPTVEEIERSLRLAVRAIPPRQLWVNPDCGLKTRGYDEVIPALRNLVEAAHRVRADL